MIKMCEYGCGKEATHQFKNGKWCCSKSKNSCSGIRLKFSESHKGENHHYYGKKRDSETKEKIRLANIGKKASEGTKKKHSERLKKLWAMNESPYRSIEYLSGLSERTIKQWKNDKIKNKMISGIKKAAKRELEYWEREYPLFSQIEEMRYNPDKPEEKEIQVHCKNHNCENSKEKGGWFTPTYIQIYERIRGIEKTGNDGSYFYCSEQCKEECPLYGSRGIDPFKEIIDPYTQEEIQVWRQKVLEQDDYKCQMCESKEDLHCHHIIPVKIKAMFALDPDNGICLCKKCHYKYAHKIGTECSTGNLANKQC